MTRILFIGNSFTFYNELPKLVRGMARAAGIDCETRMVVKGGWYLKGWNDETTPEGKQAAEALADGPWDYVVLQDQSAGPITDPDSFFAASADLCRKARAAGAVPVFFQSWPYRRNSPLFESVHMDYDEMYRQLKDAYTKAAEDNHGLLAPIGDAFYHYVPVPGEDEDLMAFDNRHPSPKGSFIAAAVMFRTIFPKASAENYLPFTPEQAADIWKYAKQYK